MVGWIFGHPNFPNGTHYRTDAVRTDSKGNPLIDLSNEEVHCLEAMYKLGEPGLVSEHDGPGYLGDIWKPSLFKRAKRIILME